VATVDTKPVAAAPPAKSRTGVGLPNASQPVSSQPNSATQANNTATQASNVNRQPGRAAAPDSIDTPSANAFTFSANVAKNVNEVKLAIVKFEIPSGDGAGMTTGTGFLINEKGWVATNWHVIEDATTAARARMSNGATCALAGIVAKSPEHDLAIVKLAERPVQLTVLNIAFDGEPELAADVLAFGHPMNEDFVVRKGAISTVLTTGDLIGEAGHSHLVETIKAPRSLVWIRHDAGILPGNSGGPLFLADGRVLGVNTFINAITHSGYASHIRYLRELAARSNDVVQPLPDRQAAALVETEPPPFPAGELTVSADRMKELYDAAAAASFKPTTADEYLPFAELARQMTYARYLQLGKQKAPRGEVEQRSQYANDLFGHMRAFDFSPKHVQALNAQATAAMEKPRGGVVFLGVVTGSGPGVLLVSVESTEQLVCVPSSTAANANFGTRVLVVGVVGPQVQTVTDAQRKPHRIPVLLSHHIGELTTPAGD
jgi:S1-C subfamily serine protease